MTWRAIAPSQGMSPAMATSFSPMAPGITPTTTKGIWSPRPIDPAGNTGPSVTTRTNQMTSAAQYTSAGGTFLSQATSSYDVFGRRLEEDVWTQSSGTTTVSRFAYDGDQV